jgi:hypothetical protein
VGMIKKLMIISITGLLIITIFSINIEAPSSNNHTSGPTKADITFT